MKIVVINNGFVFVCKTYSRDGDTATMTTARCIRTWGTTGGLGQLVSGPTDNTVLDATIPIVAVPMHQVVFTFDVGSAWDKHL